MFAKVILAFVSSILFAIEILFVFGTPDYSSASWSFRRINEAIHRRCEAKKKPRHTYPPCSLVAGFFGRLLNLGIAQREEPTDAQPAMRARDRGCARLPHGSLSSILFGVLRF
jgi:hypothetical protein